MKVIRPVDENGKFTFSELYGKNTIFLAGPCPRNNYEEDWRNEAIELLEAYKFSGKVFNPTNPKYDVNDSSYLLKQTKWEVDAMDAAAIIIFWIPRSEKNPAFTTNIELGQWLNFDKAVIGWPDGSIKNEYIQARLDLIGKERYDNLEELIRDIVFKLRR